jgi:hypothetical protein
MWIRVVSVFFLMVVSQPVVADPDEEFLAAGMQLGIAANCRASYGDHELFEVAFARFEDIALRTGQDITDKELDEAKQKFYEMEAETEENIFMRGFCKNLREELLPFE